MATKVTILGKGVVKRFTKPIQFLFKLEVYENGYSSPRCNPSEWDNIELVCKKYKNGQYDLMFAYDNSNRNDGRLYLGYFNDGVV